MYAYTSDMVLRYLKLIYHEKKPSEQSEHHIRGMSLKFVDSLSTAQHKQLLVFSAISLYSVMYQVYMCEK